MKKVIIAIFLCFILLIGCSSGSRMEHVETISPDTSMFVIIEQNINYYVVYHKETKVMYTISHGGYNAGNFTLLVNADGSPMTYKEETK